MPDNIKELLKELKAGLTRLYGKQLKAVYLYGSYARGDYDKESDLDVLIVLSHFERRSAEIQRTSALVGELSLKYNLTVSTLFMREIEWKKAEISLLRNIRAESVAV